VVTVRTPTHDLKFDVVVCNMSTIGSDTSAFFNDVGNVTSESLAMAMPVNLSVPANVLLDCFDRGSSPRTTRWSTATSP